MNSPYEYGYWPQVVIFSLIFVVFAFSFTRPKHWRDWRQFGTFAAFMVALFTEMYGFPLTIYLLSGWLSSSYPGLNLYAHENGHLWQTLLGIGSESPLAAHFNLLHIFSNLLIAGGVLLIMNAWRILYQAQRSEQVATTGPYAYVRHPQYVGFVAVLTGFILQWPTLLTVLMFPVLVWMYARLAVVEEKEIHARFGATYQAYAEETPRFIPHRRNRLQTFTRAVTPPEERHG